jgi:pentatricopeptide repeat protein
MLWRVGRGNRQSLHQLVHSLADLFIPSSLHSSRPYPSIPLTCLRSFALSRPRVQPALTSHDHDDSNTTISPSPNPVQFNRRQSDAPPVHDVPSEYPSFTETSSDPSAAPKPIPEKIANLLAGHRLERSFSDGRKASRLAQSMASTPHPRKALLALVAAHQYGCQLGREAYEAVARRLAAAREWRLISTLARLQKRQSGRQTTRLLDWRIRALVEMSQFSSLDRALGWFEEEGLIPSRRTYHLLLSGHLRNRNIVKATDVIQRMLKAGFGIDTHTHATVVSAYRTLGPDVVVQRCALNALEDADANTSTRILNALLQFSIDTRDTENLLSLIRHFDLGTFDGSQLPFGVRPLRREGEDVAFSDLIRSSILSHTSHLPLPDIATYTILLHYMASQGDLLSAHDLLGQMEHSSVTPDGLFIAALIRLYFAIGQPSAAVNVVSAVCAGVEGFRTEFRNIPLAFESQEELPLPHVLPKPTVEIFNALAAGLLHLCGIGGLQACLRLMQLCQVNPDRHTQALLVSHLIDAKGFTMADVARFHKELSLNDLPLSHLSQSLTSSLRPHFRKVKRSGWNSTPGNHNLFPTEFPSHLAPISTVGKSFDPTAGIHLVKTHQNAYIRPIIQSLADRGVLADHRMFALRIRYEAVIKGDMRAAKNIFQLMLDRGLHPNEYHYAALMEGYTATGRLAAAEAVMHAAERGGVRPNSVLHTILIVGYARQKNTQRAMWVLRRMITSGVRPDVPAVDAITSVFFAAGAYRFARQTLLCLWPSVAPLPPNSEQASLKMLVFHLRNVYDGQTSSKKLVPRERREFIRKLKALSRPRFLTEKSRTDPDSRT